MPRRALLIASQIHGLRGCEGDVALMQELLKERGFTCATVTTADATRAGILAAFDELINVTIEDDIVVVYYSGHGGRMPHPEWQKRRDEGQPAHLQFILPSDIEGSTEENFRGLLAEEITALQRRLTDRTQNVTTILDCCHSAYMARDVDLMPKATTRSFPVLGAVARLRTIPPIPLRHGTDTNDIAIRIVACHPEQSAYERTTPFFHGRHGVLTESLAVVLRDLGDRDVSWGVVADLVRRRVLTVTALQRPEVEGPAERVPFSVRTKARPYALAVTADASGLFIEAAPLLGVSLGDAFQLQVPGTGEELATAVVERFAGDRAVLTITTPPMGEFPVALDAVPLRMAVPKQAVRLDVRDDTRAALRTLLDASPRLRLAKTNEPAIATIVGDGGLVVRDSNRAPLHSGTLTDDRVGRHRAVNLIEVAARAERLRALTSGHQGTTYLETPVVIELASHGAAGRSIRAQYGEQLFNGESISVTVRNDGDKAVYIWLFDIGVANQITLTTNDAPSGFRLSPAGSPGDARTIGGADGIPLSWPPGIPADGPRVETFVVIIADRPQDLHVLESSRSHERVRTTSSLDAILDEVRIGTREWPIVQTDAGLRYRVERIEFLLDPRTKSAFDEPVFEVDETPHLTLRLLQPRTAALPPGRVAVRLAELVVRRNGALFGASIRIDTLVMTGSEAGGVVATPRTMHFPNVHAGDILPLENALLYLGDVHEFLDLALWVWREDSKGKDLAELFADQIGTDDMQGALTVVGGLILASSAVLPAVGVVAAAAMLLRIAARLVHTATRRDIGVYRTSKLAFERFGVGRTPPQHRKQAQNVEFAYEIVEVE